MVNDKILEKLREQLGEDADDLLAADGFDAAIIGTATRCGRPPILVYDARKCIEVLMKRDGMTREEAEEFFSFNTEGAWVGDKTPAYVWTLK